MNDGDVRLVVGLMYNALTNLANQAQNYNQDLVDIMKEIREIILVEEEKE